MPFDFEAAYGDFLYGNDLDEPVGEVEKPIRLSTADTPHRDGAYFGPSYYDPWGISVSGSIMPPDPSAPEDEQRAYVEARLRALAVAHAPRRGAFRRLRLHSDALFLFARPRRFSHTNSKFLKQEFQCAFECAPFFHAAEETTLPLATSGTTTIPNPGTADALPRLVLNVTAAPAGSKITIANTTATGDPAFVLNFRQEGAIGEYVVYSTSDLDIDPERLLAGSIRHASLGDVTRLRSGGWLRLMPGSNTLSVVVTGGAVLASASCVFRSRYE